MGVNVFIAGDTGSGKSYSLRNFKQGEVLVMNVANKLLPFRGKLDTISSADYLAIGKAFQEYRDKYKRFVVDDSQYLLVFEMFERANEKGYEKYTQMAVRFEKMLEYVSLKMPQDTIVYYLHHSQMADDGIRRAKTVGKMLDSYLSLEGLTTICLHCQNINGKHTFVTQSDGTTTAKSPAGMFEMEIDNDLKYVDETIREFYGMKG